MEADPKEEVRSSMSGGITVSLKNKKSKTVYLCVFGGEEHNGWREGPEKKD